MEFNAVFNGMTVIWRRPVHLFMPSWSSFNQYSIVQYSFQATGCFPTQPLSKSTPQKVATSARCRINNLCRGLTVAKNFFFLPVTNSWTGCTIRDRHFHNILFFLYELHFNIRFVLLAAIVVLWVTNEVMSILCFNSSVLLIAQGK